MAAVLLAAAAALALVAVPAGAATEDGFRMADPRITESSGLAASRAHPHTVWTVNDSGDTARVFAVDTRTGQTVATHSFGAPVRDVEALAMGPDGRLYVGDIGDNTGSRELVRVFWFDEPGLGESSGGWASWELAYPDGPRDAEALVVDPGSGRLAIVSKGADAGVYLAPPRPSRTGVNRLERVADAPAGVTDGVHLGDGRVALRGYLTLTLLDARTWQVQGSHPLPLQPQGETIALADEGRSLLVGSEGAGSQVLRVPVPAGPAPTTAPQDLRPSPARTATPSLDVARPTSPAARPPSPAAASQPSRGGALLAAGFVVVGGAALVAWWRRSRAGA